MFGRKFGGRSRWRVGSEFRWGIRPISALIIRFFSDIQFHIENTDGPEEEDQEDGTFCLKSPWKSGIRFLQRIGFR